ncbi:hypothetical protein CHUAL_002476 [Chamberlinius hualienensis]
MGISLNVSQTSALLASIFNGKYVTSLLSLTYSEFLPCKIKVKTKSSKAKRHKIKIKEIIPFIYFFFLKTILFFFRKIVSLEKGFLLSQSSQPIPSLQVCSSDLLKK